MAEKRKRCVLTLETKLKIIQALENGNSQRVVGVKLGVSKSTVADIWKDRKKISDSIAASELSSYAKKRCIIRAAKYVLVDDACWKWFCRQRSKGAPISGPLMQEKALFFRKLYQDADPESFKASTGWLKRFNTRHRIRNEQLRCEIMSSDSSAVGPFREELEKVIADEGYSRDQLFNADETGLWWRMTPTTSLNCGATRARNFKNVKDRVTVLACANASGTHRLLLAVINKSAKPRCFKHMDTNALPVHCLSQKKSWMDCKLFG